MVNGRIGRALMVTRIEHEWGWPALINGNHWMLGQEVWQEICVYAAR